MSSPPRRRAAFTLLEVLVAMVLLTVVLIALQQAFASNIFFTAYNRSLWKAVVYAHNELLRFERLPSPGVSIDEGDFDEDHPLAGYHWKREVTDEQPIPGVKVRRVGLTLSWEERAQPRSYEAEVYVVPR